MGHRSFFIFLLFLVLCALLALAAVGMSYYLTPVAQRPFRSDYALMKPSGNYSHGLGILGSGMILLGVALYSSRKRMHRLRNLGKLPSWLHFHIFLCLLGPVLILYHTTFKAGGIAAISLWSMLSVVSSGVVGRFLYVQIPRNLKGHELSFSEIQKEIARLGEELSATPLGLRLVQRIDESFSLIPQPLNVREAFITFFLLRRIKRHLRHSMRSILSTNSLARSTARRISQLSLARAALIQKSLVLKQAERLFYYWHVIHLPFTAIMFITLVAHVTVALLMGYRWIF